MYVYPKPSSSLDVPTFSNFGFIYFAICVKLWFFMNSSSLTVINFRFFLSMSIVNSGCKTQDIFLVFIFSKVSIAGPLKFSDHLTSNFPLISHFAVTL